MNFESSEGILHERRAVERVIDSSAPLAELEACDCLSVELITEGSGVHCVGTQFIPCKAGELYIVPSGTLHGYYLTEPGAVLEIRRLALCVRTWLRGEAATVGGRHYCYGIFTDGAEIAYAMLNAEFLSIVQNAMDTVERELRLREDEWRTVVSARITELLSLVGRYINRSDKYASSRESSLVSAVTEIVSSELGDPELSLASIARRLFVSTSRLSRVFKTERGRLFSEYLRDARMERAARLLREGEESVESIAAQCGLRDLPSFYRNFRRMLGVPPQTYRQLINTKNTKNPDDIGAGKGEKEMELLNQIAEGVENGRAKLVREKVQAALDAGITAEVILNEGLLAAMNAVGERFKCNEIYVPEVLVAARAMSMGTQILKPYLTSEGASAVGRVCIGTVHGDLHDIGKNLVKMLMEGKGLEVIDLGTDVAPETFVQTAIEKDCRIICCSALLTTTMPVMEEVVRAAEAAGIRDKVKIMVGGAPVNEAFAKKIGADIYTSDAASAADAAVSFCKE